MLALSPMTINVASYLFEANLNLLAKCIDSQLLMPHSTYHS